MNSLAEKIHITFFQIIKKYLLSSIILCFFLSSSLLSYATTDTIPEPAKRTFIDKIIDKIKKDSNDLSPQQMKTTSELFVPYENLIIRNIYINRIPFGTFFADTSQKINNTLTHWANSLHHLTNEKVIEKNLFFKKDDKIQPYLMADNERYLRQLSYLVEASIQIIPVSHFSDSADIIVNVKDVFSLGGSIGSLGLQKTQIDFRDDNIKGSGNAAIVYSLYDSKRSNKFAFGGEYISRNIAGSFINGRIGYQSYYSSYNTPKQENYYYLNLEKDLENRYMKWTYQLDLSYGATRNHYFTDSLYLSDYRYNYYNIDAWAGYNIDARHFSEKEEKEKLRKLIGLRFIEKETKDIPTKYETGSHWPFADLTALLANFTYYRQNFVKTNYIYGFGRSEDIPEGIIINFTTGYTIKEKENRPYVGLNFEKYQFNNKQNYIGYKIRTEGFFNGTKLEDINFLVSVNYIDHLKRMGSKWMQRFFLNLDVAQQVNTVLNEPLYINSKYGLPEFGTDWKGGPFRGTIKAESVFFSPWSLASFRFAPFTFANLSVFSPYQTPLRLLSSLGAGLRTRNESLVFGTIELKGYYFPQKNFYNKNFSIEISTNVIFKYNTQLVKRPDFIEIN
jgi:hypothetical protein